MLNKNSLTTIVAAVILMGLGYCNIASAQISDAQIWDVQTPNAYTGGYRGNEGFFFGAEGLYWALPSPKSAVVGNEAAAGENAYSLGWTVRNDSTRFFVLKDTGGDDEDDSDDSDDSDDGGEDGGTTNSGSNINIVDSGSSSSSSSGSGIDDLFKKGYDIISLEDAKDYTLDQYGPLGRMSCSTQHNDWNTGMLDTKFHVGQRYTFGFMTGHNGWECSVFTIGGKTAMQGEGVQVAFADKDNNNDGLGNNYLRGFFRFQDREENWQDSTDRPDGLYVDRMLVQYDSARMWDQIDTWGVELNYLRRAHATRIGMFELGLGVRYMKWDEEFGFWGGSDRSGNGEIYAPNFLDDTSITTEADNNLIGPQIGLKWSRNVDRFGMEILAKFTAAYNAQQIDNRALLGSNGYANGIWGTDSIYGDLYMGPVDDNDEADEDNQRKMVQYYADQIGPNGVSGYSKESFDVFTPIAEVGVKFKYDLTSKINFSLGWSGIYAGNIARPAGMTDYTLDMANRGVLGINSSNHESDVFMHGFVFGLTLNR